MDFDQQDNSRLKPINLEEEVKKSFISYAMAVIISRALPDVRDGLKPVHRRVLYAMSELGNTPDKPFKKSARIVGEVMGKYHPHGDTAIYDTMVRMAQDFATRYPLVEGQGNFGSVDGDSAAAMRYTEARMSKITLELLGEIDKDTVDFGPNFDETLTQPLVLPSRFPNLLVNGSNGIAVGMATNIPPHNLGEVIDGVIALIDNPDISIDELMAYIPGPDFPTGATIMGRAGIREAYHTGRGRIIVRANSEIEAMSANRSRIVITESPYQVNKARLVEKIAELVQAKVVDGISDLREESDRKGMRIVIELKKDVNANVVLNTLYKHTQLQDTFGAIMLALVDGEPKVLSLKQMLYHYLEHQKQVIVRRTQYDLDRALKRAHTLEGLIIALDHIDAVINLIRASQTVQIARDGLMSQFSLSEAQAVAILEMRLQRLTNLEREKIQGEYEEVMKNVAYLRGILADPGQVLQIIRTELTAIKARFGDPRRTQISAVANEIDMEDLIQEEDMAVTMTHFGYIKRLSADTYRTQNRAGKGVIGLSTRDEDFVENIFVTSTHNHILFFTNMGRAYRIKCYEIPEAGRQAKGTAIVNLLQLDHGEKVTAAFPVPSDSYGQYLFLATRQGVVKKTPLSEFDNIRKGGLIAVNLREDDELIGVCLSGGDAEILLGTRQGMCIRFSERDVRPMGRPSTGVRGIDLAQGDEVVGMGMVLPGAEVLSIAKRGYGKRTAIEEFRVQSRGGKGIKAMNLTDKTGELADIELVYPDQDLMMISNDGTVIRIPVASISQLGRNTQGVMLMRLAGDSEVVSVAPVEHSEEAELPDHEPSEEPELPAESEPTEPEAELPDPDQPDADPVETLAQDDFTPAPAGGAPFSPTGLDRLIDRAEGRDLPDPE